VNHFQTDSLARNFCQAVWFNECTKPFFRRWRWEEKLNPSGIPGLSGIAVLACWGSKNQVGGRDFQLSKRQDQADRAVVGTQHLVVDIRGCNAADQIGRYQEVVEPPADVALPGAGDHVPP